MKPPARGDSKYRDRVRSSGNKHGDETSAQNKYIGRGSNRLATSSRVHQTSSIQTPMELLHGPNMLNATQNVSIVNEDIHAQEKEAMKNLSDGTFVQNEYVGRGGFKQSIASTRVHPTLSIPTPSELLQRPKVGSTTRNMPIENEVVHTQAEEVEKNLSDGAIDKSWIHKSRASDGYKVGINKFLGYAFQRTSIGEKILCPCNSCNNCLLMFREDVLDHLVCEGFTQNYTCWYFHGEGMNNPTQNKTQNQGHDKNNDDHEAIYGMLEDTHSSMSENDDIADQNDQTEGIYLETDKFFTLLKGVDKELYPGCDTYTKLSFQMALFHVKCLNGWSDKSFDMLLEILRKALPDGKTLPSSYYEMRKTIRDLGLDYKKIHACPNDCQLYWKEYANDDSCGRCKASRWKNLESAQGKKCTSKKGKAPAKVLHHFPLVPRLQRLFMSSKTASFLRWHDEHRIKDGLLRHPADTPAWKTFDYHHPLFSTDTRNIRLGLASDGFNPFRTMNTTHSTWPVLLVIYNLPPWMCMKQPYIIMSLLIEGPHSPGNDVDVYLQPLIDELKELWKGVDTYDSSKNETFQMRAALMWTINDFPGYADLSRWSTKGMLACPKCHKDTCSRQLKHGRKQCYLGHRRFLPHDHKFRKEKAAFDGSEEYRDAPRPLLGDTVLDETKDMHVTFGKKCTAKGCTKKSKTNLSQQPSYNWRKRSIFFDLPYWKDNLIRHNLDVMHIEKNVCDNILGTLLDLEGKDKDNIKSRYDLMDMGIRKELHPQHHGTRVYLPPACFNMDDKEKEIFCGVLKEIKVPDGYASNISRRVKGKKLLNLKSHDCHVLMQQLLPLALRRSLPKKVTMVLTELCYFFKAICSKTLRITDLQLLESRIALTLCQMERIFPPSFFTIMVHLLIHLAEEARLAGPVQYRWMYPIERYLMTLKSYVRNKSRPEGSIAQGYLAEECLTFCSRYLHNIESKLTRPTRNLDETLDVVELEKFSIFSRSGRGLGSFDVILLDHTTLVQAHRHVLFNCDAISPFIESHLNILATQYRRARDIERKHNEQFHIWFRDNVKGLTTEMDALHCQQLERLAHGPNCLARRYKGFIVNGLRFHVKDVEVERKVQNSGVMVEAKTSSFSSAKDKNLVTGDVSYYGVLKDIIKLEYGPKFTIVLFKCDWVDVLSGSGVKTDEFGLTIVNLDRILNSHRVSDEPFILASQAEQVFYSNDPIDKEWYVVLKAPPRDLIDLIKQNDVQTFTVEEGQLIVDCDPPSSEVFENFIPNEDTDLSWLRTDIDGRYDEP